jgi:hypothetical protein
MSNIAYICLNKHIHVSIMTSKDTKTKSELTIRETETITGFRLLINVQKFYVNFL